MPSTRDRVEAVLDHVVESVGHLEKPVLHLVLPVLNQAHNEVEASLRRWIAQQHGADRFTAQRYRNVLLHLKYAIEQIESTGVLMEKGLKRSTAKIGPLSVRNLEHEWKHFSAIFEGSAQPIALDEAVILATGRKLLWTQFESSAAKYAGSVGERTLRELAVSRARSETIDELTNRLTRTLPDVFRANRWDAERLARTETLNSYNVFHSEGIAEAQDEDPELRERWDATYDFRRCPMCASLDGQTIDPSKGEKFVAHWYTFSKGRRVEHTRVIEYMLAHPVCRCVRTIWRASWAAYSRNKREVSEAEQFSEAA